MHTTVCFDFWNTLMWEPAGALRTARVSFWRERLGRHAPHLDTAWLGAAHDRAHERYVQAWQAGRQFVVADAIDEMLAGAAGDDTIRRILTDGFDAAGRAAPIEPAPGVAACLHTLTAAGRKLGIICDIGLTPSRVVRELLERHDLLRLFTELTFSDEIGAYKPAAEAFAHCLAGCGEENPANAVHVGDRTRTDVAGARAAGLTAVRYAGIYDDPVRTPAADAVIERLDQLPGVLATLDA